MRNFRCPDQELAPGKAHGKGRPVAARVFIAKGHIMLRSLCALLLVSSALSAPRQLAEDHGHVLVEITSDKSTTGKSGIAVAVISPCTFATSGSAPVFCH